MATALGHTACPAGYSVLFAAAIDVVNRLNAAETSGQLAREIKRYQSPRLLIIDELGYLPLDKRGAELLFQVIAGSDEYIYTCIPYWKSMRVRYLFGITSLVLWE